MEVHANPGAFNCETCTAQYCDDTRAAPFDRWEIPGVIKSRTCLKPMVTDEAIRMIKLYNHYKRGILLTAGGLLDQPNYYLAMMEIAEGWEGQQVAARDNVRADHGRR